MFTDSVTFTFGYNTDLKKREPSESEVKWRTGSCSKCRHYVFKETLCLKYNMISKPDQKCKAFKE